MLLLTPAYDLINTAIVNPTDKEELALTLNGKKSKIGKADFVEAAARSNIQEKIIDRLFSKYIDLLPKMTLFIENSFLEDNQKSEYINLIKSRLENFGSD